MNETFMILWPERRVVSADRIRSWYGDAVANDEVEVTDITDPEGMAKELHSAGLITLGRSE